MAPRNCSIKIAIPFNYLSLLVAMLSIIIIVAITIAVTMSTATTKINTLSITF